MPHFHVLLAELPPLLEGILLESMAAVSDLAVTTVATRADLLERMRQSAPDVLVIGAASAVAPTVALEFRQMHATLIVLVIAPTGESAVCFGRDASAVELRDVSTARLLTVIRGGLYERQ